MNLPFDTPTDDSYSFSAMNGPDKHLQFENIGEAIKFAYKLSQFLDGITIKMTHGDFKQYYTYKKTDS